MDRRNLLQILAISSVPDFPAIAQHHSDAAAGADVNVKSYRPRLLLPDEYSLVSAFCDVLIPADADSGGALDAGVPYYVDSVLFYSEAPVQASWHADLQRLRTWVSQRFGSDLSELDKSNGADAMAELLRNEQAPSSDLDLFIVRLKQLVIDAYCVSSVGLRHFHYTGNTAIPEFPGCTHPEHLS